MNYNWIEITPDTELPTDQPLLLRSEFLSKHDYTVAIYTGWPKQNLESLNREAMYEVHTFTHYQVIEPPIGKGWYSRQVQDEPVTWKDSLTAFKLQVQYMFRALFGS